MNNSYFSHDSNAKDDPKVVMLIEQLGLEGYGIFWVLIEHLREQPGYRYPMGALGAIARRYQTSQEKVETVIRGYGLFHITEDEFFLSESLCRRMAMMEKRKKALSAAGKKGNAARWHKQGLPSPGDNKAIATQSQIKEKKEKEIFIYNQFYDIHLKESEKENLHYEYESFVRFLFGKNDTGEPLESVLALPKQFKYNNFSTLINKYRGQNSKLKDKLLQMDNKPDLRKKYTSAYLTLNAWMKND